MTLEAKKDRVRFYAVEGQFIVAQIDADCAECGWKVLKVEYPGAQLGCWAGEATGEGCILSRAPDLPWMKERRDFLDKTIKEVEGIS